MKWRQRLRENGMLWLIIAFLLGGFTMAIIDALHPPETPPSVTIRPHLKNSGEELVVVWNK
jgi:hypothetical protein